MHTTKPLLTKGDYNSTFIAINTSIFPYSTIRYQLSQQTQTHITMKTTTFALTLLLSQYAIVDGQIANASQRRVSPTDRFRTLRTTRALQEDDDGSMSLATSMSMMAVEPEAKDMFEITEESIEAVEPAVGGGYDGFDPADYSGSSKGGKMYKSKATKLFKSKSEGDAKAEKAYTSKATKKGGKSSGRTARS